MLNAWVYALQIGGILNPPECMEAAPPSAITRIGDVCVAPWSNNWCEKCLYKVHGHETTSLNPKP